MERKKTEVIEFKKEIESEVKIVNGNKVEAEAKILSKLKRENELVVNSEDETGVVSVAEIDSMTDEDGIESDIRTVADDEKR